MKVLAHQTIALWQRKTAFKISVVYLITLGILILALPWLPLPFAPDELDLNNIFASPFDFRNYVQGQPFHWLGTDALGRDVLVSMLYGAQSAFFISVPVMLLTTFIGLVIGGSAGYYGDNRLSLSRGTLLTLAPTAFALFFYGIYVPLNKGASSTLAAAFPAFIILAVALLVLWLAVLPVLLRISFFRSQVTIALDRLVLNLIELFSSLPRFILILLLASFLPPSVVLLAIILALTCWTGTARLARAEMLRIRELPYFESATTIGASRAKLLLHHALPNMLSPILVSFVFGVAGLLTLESTLSFLGIGIPPTLVSWGRIITGIRFNISAWWLVVFPGAFLSLTVLALQTCSNSILANRSN